MLTAAKMSLSTAGRRRATHDAASIRGALRSAQSKAMMIGLALAVISSLPAALNSLSHSPAFISPEGRVFRVDADAASVSAPDLVSADRTSARLRPADSAISSEEGKVPAATLERNVTRTARRGRRRSRRRRRRRAKEEAGSQPQADIRPFRILTSAEISKRLHGLAGEHPDFSNLASSQERFGLPAAGTPKDCPHDGDEGGCKNWILTIEDKRSHPEGSDSWRSLPEVFLSGALHGDERVGPTTVTEAAALLLDSAECESLPRGVGDVRDPDLEARMALDCRSDLRDRGVDDDGRRWLARLVSTRRIVIVPTPNALGYDRGKREEGSIDPNRDFPYDLLDWSLCMQTIAGRTINEIFREHVFQLSITFHGGMEAVAYEWGAPTYLHYTSPDDVAQSEIASGYSRYSGGFHSSSGKTPPYQTGTMNDVVYYVRGGMEDWAYAASWDPDRVNSCVPSTFGGYPAEKTQYDETTLRAFNMLVETSNRKNPREGTLGTTENPLSAETEGNGHVSRNIRLALLAIELVEPYVSVASVDGVRLSDDIVPSVDPTGRTCIETKAVKISPGRADIAVEWTVGGGFSVDDAYLVHARWDDLPDSVDGSGHLSPEELRALGSKLTSVAADRPQGTTRWHPDGATIFRAVVDATVYRPGDRVAVFAVAKLDQSWSIQPAGGGEVKPAGPARSHVVRARTDPGWRMVQEATGKFVQGRYDWFSVPVTLVIGEVGTDATVELSVRLGSAGGDGESSAGSVRKENGILGKQIPNVVAGQNDGTDSKPETMSKSGKFDSSVFFIVAATAGVLVVALVLMRIRVRRQRRLGYRNVLTRTGSESGVWDAGFREEDAHDDFDEDDNPNSPYSENSAATVELSERKITIE